MSAVVLDLLNSGIDVPDILDQLVGPQAPAPADEPEAAAETERFLSVDEARGNEDEDDEDDEDDAAAPVARGRGARRSRGRGRHRGTRPRPRRPQQPALTHAPPPIARLAPSARTLVWCLLNPHRSRVIRRQWCRR